MTKERTTSKIYKRWQLINLIQVYKVSLYFLLYKPQYSVYYCLSCEQQWGLYELVNTSIAFAPLILPLSSALLELSIEVRPKSISISCGLSLLASRTKKLEVVRSPWIMLVSCSLATILPISAAIEAMLICLLRSVSMCCLSVIHSLKYSMYIALAVLST